MRYPLCGSIHPPDQTSSEMAQKKFCSKKFGPETFLVQNIFGPKNFLGPNKFWVDKNLGSQKMLGQNKFWVQKMLGPKKFR